MQHLHAYWRVDYVKAPKKWRKPPFLAELRSKDRRSALVLYENANSFVMLNRYPYNPGHVLAIPRREVEQMNALTGDERKELWETVFICEEAIRAAMNPDGMNVGFNFGSAAGAGIPKHLHCHIVPRWEGDTNFMPVIGSVKVMPQALTSIYDQLLPHFQKAAKSIEQ